MNEKEIDIFLPDLNNQVNFWLNPSFHNGLINLDELNMTLI